MDGLSEWLVGFDFADHRQVRHSPTVLFCWIVFRPHGDLLPVIARLGRFTIRDLVYYGLSGESVSLASMPCDGGMAVDCRVCLLPQDLVLTCSS